MNYSNFEKQINYETTFIENNSGLIKNMTASDYVTDYTRSDLDMFAGIDCSITSDRTMKGLALRIRRPRYEKWNKNFTISGHIENPNSQIRVLLNSINGDAFYPHLILQINGVNDSGDCEKAKAILIQSNVFAKYLSELINRNKLEGFYNQELDAYEFNFIQIFKALDNGVTLFGIENNRILYEISNS